ncbi:MAG: cytochrome c-type biogenesis protein CcmH [Sterolibacteriaceae bacterium MAG5]|nr:cytochrome c-type biogenesis protein CcmH [Candidatus Nitricoxidireducens bremensis]
MKRTLILLAALLSCSLLQAKEAAPLAEDEAVEKRLVVISEELRCLVCQNESLAGSRADLAQDLRREVRKLIKDGKTDQEVRDFLVSRYGDFVLYRPPVKPTTWLLWVGPFVLMAAGIAVLIVYLRRRSREVKDTLLSDEERRRAEALLKESE